MRQLPATSMGQRAVTLVRQGQRASATGDPADLEHVARAYLRDMSGRERARLLSSLAVIAANLAGQLPLARREAVLAVYEGSQSEMAATALLLLFAAAGGTND